MRLYLIAFQFLTIVPLPFDLRWRENDLGRSMALFPLVGLTLGALLAGVDYLLSPVLPRPLADLLLVVVLTLVTGALHLDGLADVCDGLAARGGRERFLAVMKDSRVGAVGVVGLVLGLLLKYQALLGLPLAVKREALLFFPLIARFSQVMVTVGSQRARDDGLGAACIAGAGRAQLLIAAAFAGGAAWLLLGSRGLVVGGILATTTWIAKGWFHRRLGGITGDIIGCISELNEILCLVLLVAAGTIS